VPQYSGTNHLGRQRPPPNTTGAASPDRRAANASPFSSPGRARRQAFSSDRSLGGSSAQAGGDGDGTASVGTLPTFLQQALDRSRGERSYEEFQAWLESNREWRRRRELKVRCNSEGSEGQCDCVAFLYSALGLLLSPSAAKARNAPSVSLSDISIFGRVIVQLANKESEVVMQETHAFQPK
jgi:hypothetical protein